MTTDTECNESTLTQQLSARVEAGDTMPVGAGLSPTVRDLIDHHAKVSPDCTFLIDPLSGESVSYSQLQAAARAVAIRLVQLEISPGDSVAYAMHNGVHCAKIILGIMYAGSRAVAINLVAGRDVIGYVLAHSQTRLVFTQDEHVDLIDQALQSESYHQTLVEFGTSDNAQLSVALNSEASLYTQIAADSELSSDSSAPPNVHHYKPTSVVVDDDWIESLLAQTAQTISPTVVELESSTILSDDDALLMYTSGTTGRPKGVVLSHGNVISGGVNVMCGHELSAADRALCVLPLYHINGLCVTLFAPLVTVGSVVIPARFSTSAFWELIDKYQCSWFSVVPTQIAYLLRDADPVSDSTSTTNEDVSALKRAHLRFGRSASAPLSPDVHGVFEERFGIPLIETMGLTETAAQILTNPMPPARRKLGSPGLPVGDEVIICDSELQELSHGTEGELLVRGPNVMQRYFRNPEATAQAITEQGWLRTGDLGRKDADGYLYITGRLKELIIKGGENIAPREIDDALYQHKDVVEAAAFAQPCDNFGQRVEAAVSIKAHSLLSESDLLELCINSVGKFKCPDKIHFLEELPKGPSGKIQRAKIASVV